MRDCVWQSNIVVYAIKYVSIIASLQTIAFYIEAFFSELSANLSQFVALLGLSVTVCTFNCVCATSVGL